jgi:hypothetical protein
LLSIPANHYLPSRLDAVNLKCVSGEIGLDLDLMGLNGVETHFEEPDPHQFLMTADLSTG